MEYFRAHATELSSKKDRTRSKSGHFLDISEEAHKWKMFENLQD